MTDPTKRLEARAHRGGIVIVTNGRVLLGDRSLDVIDRYFFDLWSGQYNDYVGIFWGRVVYRVRHL